MASDTYSMTATATEHAPAHSPSTDSDPATRFARMNVEAQQPLSTFIESRHSQPASDLSHYPRQVSRPSTSSSVSTSATRSRASSITQQPAPPTTLHRPQEGSHIRFRGVNTAQSSHYEAAHNQQPLPQSQAQTSHSQDIPPPSPRLQPTYPSTVSLNGSLANSPSRIRVRDLNHIQSFASEEVLTRSRHPSRLSLGGRLDGGQKYEISAMPVTDIIEMVAGLLTKITTTNDRQHEHLHRNAYPQEASSGLSQQASSVLAFHGKNVPTITIASYLMRIHKYCPTTFEVFLSLLVYFDRMTAKIKNGSLSTFADEEPRRQTRPRRDTRTDSQDSSVTVTPDTHMSTTPPSDSSDTPDRSSTDSPPSMRPMSDTTRSDLSDAFVVDSFNIHRLVMAGVTCASKFFSDVFYTNSRYAKVGGLPLVELNHLELQFLLLNDFKLSIPLEELDAYGTMLVEFYASEIVNQQQPTPQPTPQPTSP